MRIILKRQQYIQLESEGLRVQKDYHAEEFIVVLWDFIL